MKLFSSLLQNFDSTLQKYNPVNYARLQPPLPDKEIKAYLDSFGIQKDEELEALFRWKNGFDFSEGESPQYKIFDAGALLSLEHLNEYLKYQKAPENNLLWKNSFIPLTTDGSGESLLFNTESKHYGRIQLYSVPLLFIDEPVTFYDSLTSMIETTIKAYEKGIFKYDKDKDTLQINVDEFFALAGNLNKKSKYWNED